MSFLEKEVCRIDIKRLDLAWMLYSDGFRIGPSGRGLKRVFDIVVSLAILLPFSPLLLAGDAGGVAGRSQARLLSPGTRHPGRTQLSAS